MDNMDLKFVSEFKYLGHFITHFIFLFTVPSISVSSFSSFSPFMLVVCRTFVYRMLLVVSFFYFSLC